MDILDKIIEKIIKHPAKVALIVLAFFLIPLLFIHILYSFSIPFFESHWSAGDILGYISTFFSAVGTLVLGFIAVKQSQLIFALNIKANEPLFDYKFELSNGILSLLITNTHENIARKLFLINASIFPKIVNSKKKQLKIINGYVNQLSQDKSLKVLLQLESGDTPPAFFIVVNFSYSDRLAFKYYKKITIIYENDISSILVKNEKKKKSLEGGGDIELY